MEEKIIMDEESEDLYDGKQSLNPDQIKLLLLSRDVKGMRKDNADKLTGLQISLSKVIDNFSVLRNDINLANEGNINGRIAIEKLNTLIETSNKGVGDRLDHLGTRLTTVETDLRDQKIINDSRAKDRKPFNTFTFAILISMISVIASLVIQLLFHKFFNF